MTNWKAARESLVRLYDDAEYECDYVDQNRVKEALDVGEKAEKLLEATTKRDCDALAYQRDTWKGRAEAAEREAKELNDALGRAEWCLGVPAEGKENNCGKCQNCLRVRAEAAEERVEEIDEEFAKYRIRLAGVLTVLEGSKEPRPDEKGLADYIANCPTFRAAWRLRDQIEAAKKDLEQARNRIRELERTDWATFADKLQEKK